MLTVVVVGLGPADAAHLSAATRARLDHAGTARLRTRQHPAAAAFPDVQSFDELYDRADDFDALYAQIADELVRLAREDRDSTVVYAVPGSPVVAERTVAILREREDVHVIVEPSIGFVDLACAALGIDPVAVGLRVADALDLRDRLRGPGPLLLAQTHSVAILADVALRAEMDLFDDELDVVVLHHLGLDDERIEKMPVSALGSFNAADHLTSVYFPSLRTSGDAMEDLVELMDTLRARCPWDEAQTHASLLRYLVEEAYESLDALEALSRTLDTEGTSLSDIEAAAAHACEELGDLLFQVVFHARLGSEEGLFDLRAIADGVQDKLVSRHPHVFGDTVAATPDVVAARWEDLKRAEKGRESVMDGIPTALPALSLMAKVRRKSLSVGMSMPDRATLTESAIRAIRELPASGTIPDDASVGNDAVATASIGAALEALCDLSRTVGVDPEQALRDRAKALADEVRATESSDGYLEARGTAGSVVASEVGRSDKE